MWRNEKKLSGYRERPRRRNDDAISKRDAIAQVNTPRRDKQADDLSGNSNSWSHRRRWNPATDSARLSTTLGCFLLDGNVLGSPEMAGVEVGDLRLGLAHRPVERQRRHRRRRVGHQLHEQRPVHSKKKEKEKEKEKKKDESTIYASTSFKAPVSSRNCQR